MRTGVCVCVCVCDSDSHTTGGQWVCSEAENSAMQLPFKVLGAHLEMRCSTNVHIK